MAQLRPGQRLAGYRVTELVGSGGMGEVYRAEQMPLGRPVALKMIRPELAADATFRRRFRREARLTALVDHPGVIAIHEAGEAEGHLFVAMRWVEGQDLRQLLASEGPVAPERAVAMLAQLAEAVDAAHARGLLHRDIKPSNVLVEGARLYLSDFGLARSTSEGDTTRPGGLVGTVDYAAPEVIDGDVADERSDVYALGCLFFELLTGAVPYPAENLLAKLHAHSSAPVPRASERCPGVPPALDEVLARALAKRSDERFPSAAAFATAARQALGASAAPPATAPQPSRRRRGRRLRIAAPIGGLALVAGVALALLASNSHPGADPPAAGARRPAQHYACGTLQRAKWSVTRVQACPLTAGLPPHGWVPVYARPVALARGAGLPDPAAGWLHGTVGELFACQRRFPTATYHHPHRSWFNDWWAYTLSDDNAWGWVPEVYFAGGDDDQPAADLSRCAAATAPDRLPSPSVRRG